MAGELLCRYIAKSGDIELIVGMDKNADFLSSKYPWKMISLKDEIPDSDCVVIAVMSAYSDVSKQIRGVIDTDIVTMVDVLFVG